MRLRGNLGETLVPGTLLDRHDRVVFGRFDLAVQLGLTSGEVIQLAPIVKVAH